MPNNKSYINMIEVKEAYARGENILQFIQDNYDPSIPRETIIEISYDLQSGTYIESYDPPWADKYTQEHADLIQNHFPNPLSVIDIGCGELTHTQALFNKLNSTKHFFACDISFSRCLIGQKFYKENTPTVLFDKTKIFIAELLKLPFEDNSIDVIVSSHSLEPNHGKEKEILSELLRVAKRGLVLVEPSYELSDEAQRKRMETHGYIRDIPDIITGMENCNLIQNALLNTNKNPLNRSASFVIEKVVSTSIEGTLSFVDPISKTELIDNQSYLFSPIRGVSYPVIENLKILKPSVEIITNSLSTLKS